jgi:hypothetical protein
MSINKSEPTWRPNNTVHENEQKESPDPAKVAPTNVSPCVTLEGEDYGLKVSINDANKARNQSNLAKNAAPYSPLP